MKTNALPLSLAQKLKSLLPALAKNALPAFTISIVTLSMGGAFGIMSGRGAAIGMLSAAVIAFVTSLLGSTRVQCSGPTAPVTTLLVGLMASAAALPVAGVSADQFINIVFIMGGVLLLLAGVLRLGRFVSFIPNVVISGFMTGIGLLIFQSQIMDILAFATTTAFAPQLALALGTFAVAVGLPPLLKKHMPKWAGLLSGTLIAMVLGTLFTQLLGLAVPLINVGEGSLLTTMLTTQHLPPLSAISPALLLLALPLAAQLCGTMYLDTLLTSMIMDRMTKTKTNRAKELFAQGIGGMVASCLGGIPGAQATARSVLLHKEGATGRTAGVLVGVFALVILFALQGVLGLIPKAIFTGILLKVAFDIIDFTPLRLYAKELLGGHVLRQFFSHHADEPIFVTNIEFLFIAATALLTLLWGLIPAVICTTGLYWLLQKTVWRGSPLRDLNPETETTAMAGEA